MNINDEGLYEIIMKNVSKEVLAKSKQASSAEELLALAKENNIELTAEHARYIIAQLNPKTIEFSDEELSNVAGGAGFQAGMLDNGGGGGGGCS